LDHSEEVRGELVISSGDATVVLQLGEEALDEVALAVEPIAEARPRPVRVGLQGLVTHDISASR
jgi:hypothetical protein